MEGKARKKLRGTKYDGRIDLAQHDEDRWSKKK